MAHTVCRPGQITRTKYPGILLGPGILLLVGALLSACDATHETTVLADQSRREASEKGGILALQNLSASKLVVPQGTALSVRLLQSVSSRSADSGDEFEAELAAPVQVNGSIAFPRASRIRGRVVEVRRSGRIQNPGFLRLTLNAIQTTDGKWMSLRTTSVSATGGSHKKRNATLIGGGAGLGALIGGIAGGGKGAAIGAASGAGAGTAGAYATGKKDVTFFAERKLNFATTAELTLNP